MTVPTINDQPRTGGRLRWGVVGGGILGLELARQLSNAGHAVTVLESSPNFGGLADSWQVGPITWDRHYHVILMSDLRVRELIADIGLEKELRWVETKTGFYTGNKLYSMSNSLEFLKFPPLRLIDKFRLGMTILRASRIRNWRALEKIPVSDWLQRWSGRRTFEKIWRPLLRAKLGDSYTIASAAFIWSIIARMYAARRSGLKKEMFGYVRGGYAKIVEHFVSHLTDNGVELRSSAAVCRVTGGPTPQVVLADGETLSFDRVIVTAAAPLAVRLVPELSEHERNLLNRVIYQGIVCASLVIKKPLAHFYVTNITDDWVPFTAVIEMTTLIDPKEIHGRHLVYLPKYVAPDDPHFQLSDDEIRERFVSALERMYPHFSRQDVEAFRVSRVRHVFAVATLDYSTYLPPIATSVECVYLLNSAHIANGTLNVNETLSLASASLPALLANAHQSATGI